MGTQGAETHGIRRCLYWTKRLRRSSLVVGCALMLIGLYIAFFLSHKKVWIYISADGDRSRIQISGNSNKNQIGFENDFAALTDKLEQDDSLKLTKE